MSSELDRRDVKKENDASDSRARVSVKKSRRLDHLLALAASFALEVVVGVALGVRVEEEELSKVVEGEVSFRRFCAVVDDAGGERLLVGLSLEDLLLDGSL